MKKLTFALSFILVSIITMAQTDANKNELSAGFGSQQYKGNLGNTLTNLQYEWYGVLRFSYSRYLNPSFDAMAFLTTGDYGHCHNDDDNNTAEGGQAILEFRTRLTVLGASIKYKFSNGYIFKQDAKFSPYLFAGCAANRASDIWGTQPIRANLGNYFTVNGGAGLCYNICPKVHLIYNWAIGVFMNNNITFDANSGPRDLYVQNTLSVGFNL